MEGGPDQSSPLLERTTSCVSDKEGRVVFRSVFVKSSEQTIDAEERSGDEGGAGERERERKRGGGQRQHDCEIAL